MSDKLNNASGEKIGLTEEQKACLKYNGEKTLMVKGFAGSGKSLVLMAIAQRYLENYGANSQNKIAVFTYQNTLASSMKELIEKNSEYSDKVKISTVSSYIKQLYDEIVKQGAAPKRKYYSTKESRIDIVAAVLKQHKEKFGRHRFQSIDPEFWIEEFNWMKDMNIWTDDLDVYKAYKRKGRGGRYRFSQSDYETAFEIFKIYCSTLEKSNYGDWVDQAMFISRHPELVPEKMKYSHILVDEAQDLSLAQMSALMMTSSKDMTIAMDANQKLYPTYWNAKMLGMESTTKKLTKSMRTTKQIDDLAEGVRSVNDQLMDKDDVSMRAVPEKEGELPKLVHLDDQNAERKFLMVLKLSAAGHLEKNHIVK